MRTVRLKNHYAMARSGTAYVCDHMGVIQKVESCGAMDAAGALKIEPVIVLS